jgi:hypothetical protein
MPSPFRSPERLNNPDFRDQVLPRLAAATDYRRLRTMLADLPQGVPVLATTAMEFLRRQLDDEKAAPCGRCDNCAGARFTTEVSDASLDAARGEWGRPGVEVEPRRMWPTGLPAVGADLKGRIPAGEQAAAGRALGRLSGIGWGNRLRPLLAPKAPDTPVPDDVASAVVTVLADWVKGPGGRPSGAPDAPARPVGVVTVASYTRPQLIQSLAEQIASIGPGCPCWAPCPSRTPRRTPACRAPTARSGCGRCTGR